MSDRTRLCLSALAIVAVALVVWLPTIGWGLPSRDTDKYLFGDRRPWTGAEIVALTATTQPATMRGADVDADPIVDRSKPVILNDTDAKRAAIVRRYRLMSGQPDEFIQFKALSEMAARSGWQKLDPRLYQYGGLWMYPVGALVRTAMLLGYIPSPPTGTPAIEFYLDHPDAFGRFYVVARFYSWCWGLVAAFAIAWIARRVTESIGLATLAAVAFMLLPVTRTATHEAKPHLAGAALCLCAVIAATRYVETGRRRWLIGAGALCGAAMAMVVSMLLSCAVLPTMVWLRRREERSWHGRPGREDSPSAKLADPHGRDARATNVALSLAFAVVVAVAVYVATNPFVVVNAIAHPEILRSNLGNSTAMYSRHGSLFDTMTSSVAIGRKAMTAPGLITTLGLSAVSVFATFRRRGTANATTLCFLAPSLVVASQYVALANGKPSEYARFGLLSFAALCVFAFDGLRRVPTRAGEFVVTIFLICLMATGLLGFVFFSEDLHERLNLLPLGHPASIRQRITDGSIQSLALAYEPAPWSAPPIDLFGIELELMGAEVYTKAPSVNAWIYPLNLQSQIGSGRTQERVDWRQNEFGGDELFRLPPATTRSEPLNSSSRPAGSRPGG